MVRVEMQIFPYCFPLVYSYYRCNPVSKELDEEDGYA